MNNDLISRSELKKALHDRYSQWGDLTKYEILMSAMFETFNKLIDNAPTIKTYCYFCGQTEHGQIEERPQGEWIEKHSDYGVYYQCSICHKMPPNYECDYKEGAIKTNFCPNCGAKMQKGD